MTCRAVLETMSVTLMKWWAPEGQSLISPLYLPPLPPAPTPHAPYLAQHFWRFTHLVNVGWTEKLYDFFVVAVFISLVPLLLDVVCFYRWISPSLPMCWLGTCSCVLVQFGPNLALGNDFMRGVIWHYHGEWWELEGQKGLAVSLKKTFPVITPLSPVASFAGPSACRTRKNRTWIGIPRF